MGEASGWKVAPAGHEARCDVGPFTLYAWSNAVGHGWQATVDTEDCEADVAMRDSDEYGPGPGLDAMQAEALRGLRDLLTGALTALDVMEGRSDG